MKLIAIILLVIGAVPLYAQVNGLEAQNNVNMLGAGSYTARTFDNRYKGVKGSVTLLQDFSPAKIYMTDKKVVTYPKVNFDAHANELIMARNGSEYVIHKKLVNRFSIYTGTDSLHFTKVEAEDNKLLYFQVLVPGNIQLLKKNIKIFKEASYQGAYSAGREFDEFIDDEKYYVTAEGKPLTEFKNKKSLQQIVPSEYTDEIDQYIRKNNLNLKEEQHLVMLFRYLNDIVTKR
ncbi:hypothetical protein ACFQ21_05870 [Ohtaekwangia kribbensis]|jgi:hypothetical protein|uniref:DUF4369 domain-containing protein n=1 Tax=Ohtaekwangia kribbensis TaxID=688913 RepID=A0ABW3JXX6_9BACT